MSPKRILSLLTILFILNLSIMTLVMPCHASVNKKTVLVLNSYHQGFPWTDKIMHGMLSILNNSGMDIEIHVEYMDTKRYLPKDSFTNLEDLYHRKYGQTAFDVILLSDNNALTFILSRRDKLFPNVPIVFCGINNFSKDLLDGQNFITGITEEIDILGTITLATRIRQGIRKFIVINDQTLTGQANHDKFIHATSNLTNSTVHFEMWNDITIADLQNRLDTLSSDSAVLVFTFHRDKDNQWFSLSEYLSLIQNSCKVPVFSFWEHYIGHGVLGGVMVNGTEQGKRSAEYAIRILKGESATSIPVLLESPNVPIIDYRLLRKLNISKKNIPTEAVILFKPESVFSKYRYVIITSVISFAGLIALVVILSADILIRKHAKEALQKAHDELEQRVDARTRELSMANEALHVDITERKWVEEALQESEKKFRSLFENMQNGFALHEMMFDEAGTPINYIFLDVNEAFEKQTNLKKENFIGKKVTEVLPGIENDPFDWIGTYGKVVHTGNSISFESYSESVQKWYSVVAYRPNEGQFAAVFIDITERKKAKDTLHQYEHIVSSSTDMLALLDKQYKYLAANKAYMEAFKLTPEQLIGNTVANIFGEEIFNTVIKSNGDRCLGGEEVNYQDWFNYPVFGRCYMDITYYPYYSEDNKVEGFVVNGRDITARKQAEQEHLQREKIQAVLETAGAACHELNQPMQAISGYSELLSMGTSEKNPLYVKVRKIKEQIDRMGKITEKLMGITRYETKVYSGEKKIIDLDNVRERRKYKRFIPSSRAFVITKSESPKQHQIIDISMEGLAFWCDEIQYQLDEFDELSINMTDGNFYLDNIHCKRISDLTIADDSSPGSVSMKRCGVQFWDLGQSQRGQLEHFIQNHTIIV